MTDILRKLACNSEWQLLYARAKEGCGLYLFDNHTDFSKLQLHFLMYLEMYHGIYVDIAMGEKIMDYKRVQDPMLVDAYLVYKKETEKDKKTTKHKPKLPINNTGIPTLICRASKRK